MNTLERRAVVDEQPSLKKRLARAIALSVKPLVEHLLMPLLQWISRTCLDQTPSPVSPARYVEPEKALNLFTFEAAHQDQRELARDNPVFFQSLLNAAMENARTETSWLMMFGSLIGRYSPEEAMSRVIANAVLLGMSLEKRLGVISGAGKLI